MLVSACGACQNGTWLALADFEVQCPAELISPPGVYPRAIDKDTAVPHWAYLEITNTGGSFDAGLASLAGGLYRYFAHSRNHAYNIMITDSPESSYMSTTTSPASTSSLAPPITSTTSGSPTPPPASTTTSQTPTHALGGGSSHVGAIAGGVVGGMVGLLLVAILGTLLYRRKRELRRRRDDRAAATTGEGLVEDPDRRSVQNGNRKSNQPTVTQQTISSGSDTLVTPQPFVPYDPAQFSPGYEGYVRLRLVYGVIVTTLPQKYSQPNPQSPTSSRSGNQTFVGYPPPPEYSQIVPGRYTGMPELE